MRNEEPVEGVFALFLLVLFILGSIAVYQAFKGDRLGESFNDSLRQEELDKFLS